MFSKFKLSKLRFVPLVVVVLVAIIVARCTQYANARYTNVTAASGINYVQNQGYGAGHLIMAGGGAAGDFDSDGWTDLFVTRLDATDILYRNKGDGTFEDVSAAAGFTANLSTNGPAWGDIDNDGDLDLYVTSGGDTRFYLYINDGNGHFTEQAVQRGADIGGVVRYGQSVAFGDYDKDGYLDIHTNDWGNEIAVSTSRLLRNLGAAKPGYFEDVTVAAGIDVYRPSLFHNGATDTKAYRFTSTLSDLDGDGHTDLVIAGDFATSQIFWNNGDGTFTDGTLAAGVGTGEDSMGMTIGDYDGDGLLDFFESNLVNVPGQTEDHSGNRLFRNNGDRTFSDQTDAGQVRDSGWSWGTTFLDYDNDRDLDLAVTNGWPFEIGQSRLYKNNDGVFSDISNAVGITDMQMGRGLLSFDYDNDGDLDIFITNNGEQPILYRNDGGNTNDWLRINTRGTISNRDGIGALITVDPDKSIIGDEMIREVSGGSNFLSQNEFTAHFGLGTSAATVDRITVAWPSGTVQVLTNVSPNQVIELTENVLQGDYNGDGTVNAADYTLWRSQVGSTGIGYAADGNGDHAVNQLDYQMWKTHFRETFAAAASTRAVPEPSTAPLAWLILAASVSVRAMRPRKSNSG